MITIILTQKRKAHGEIMYILDDKVMKKKLMVKEFSTFLVYVLMCACDVAVRYWHFFAVTWKYPHDNAAEEN